MPAASTKGNASADVSTAAVEDTGLSDTGPIDFTTESINFDDISTSFQPKADGFYPAMIEDAEVRYSAAGNAYIALTWVYEDESGKIWSNLPWTAKSLWRTKKDCAAMGIELGGPQTPQSVASLVQNARAVLQVITEDYTNKAGEPAQRNSVAAVLSTDAPTDGATAGKTGGW